MPATARAARRAFVTVLLALAAAYGVAVATNRDSTDADLLTAFKKLILRVHPDKGGSVADMQRLQGAKEAWAQTRNTGPGRPKAKAAPKRAPKAPAAKSCSSLEPADSASGAPNVQGFRIRGLGVLLTYHGVRDVAQWERFVAHTKRHVAAWKVRNWCATLEANKDGRLHMHLMLQFVSATDTTSRRFAFEGLTPNASPHDLLGGGMGRRNLQESLDRGMFYVWADKIGTQRDGAGAQCRAGNYEPAWTQAARTYPVKGRWNDTLWKAHKLSHDVYEDYIYLCREGVLGKKRNVDAVREREAAVAAAQDIEDRVKRIRSNPSLYRPFPPVPAAVAWLEKFASDALRYPVLIAVGPSGTGKSEWAKSLFRKHLELKIGSLECFPDAMRTFARGVHDGLILDDVRDMHFVIMHQEKLQGKYDAAVEFASTQGGQLSYRKDLYAVPIVITANRTTAHLQYLTYNDFLGNVENRVVVEFPLPAGAPPAAP